MVGQDGQADGGGVEDEKAEDARPFREVADGVDGGVVEADGGRTPRDRSPSSSMTPSAP